MNKLEILKSILLTSDVVTNIKTHENILFDIIPMLKYEKHFEQKNEWHSYDVWNHTINAISSSPIDFEIRLVLLLHDIGKPFCYQENQGVRHFKGHAQKSSIIAKNILEELGYKDEKMNELLFLIQEHATTIKIENINENNIDLYNKLLIIQICDTNAYEPNHAKQIIQKLTKLKKELKHNYNKTYKLSSKQTI